LSTQDARFVPKVQHHKDAYVTVELSTKDWVSLNPKPHRTTTMVNPVLHYQSSHRGGSTNFLKVNHNLGSSQATPSHLGGNSPAVTNTNKIVNEDEQSALAQVSVSLKDLL
jgi:hypothetical protein